MNKNNLRHYFPMLKTKEALTGEIEASEKLSAIYHSWEDRERQSFLDICTGVKGVKPLYDTFFKTIMSPESAPERLEDFLSLLMERKVRILKVLPNEGARIADEVNLVLADMVVELDDGSICDVEIQKISRFFPGQRGACYSSDLLLRQYKRVRSERKKIFRYRDVKPVYTIVLYETSSAEFREFSDVYIHCFEQTSDTGLKMDLLQKYIFIPLDIFLKIKENKPIDNKREAWLHFLCNDRPERIIELIERYPEFRTYYEQLYDMCRNMEGFMGLYSEELRMLDNNSFHLMVDEMQEEIDQKKVELDEMQEELNQKREELDQKKEELNQKKEELDKEKAKNVGLKEMVMEKEQEIARLKALLAGAKNV